MFDRIAGVYDVMNSVMTVGMHQRWRERAVELARVGPGSRALDVATGTGDLAVALRAADADVVGCDFSEEMLARARSKEPSARFEWADALALPYEDDSFDAVILGWVLSYSEDPRRAAAEVARVAKDGALVAIGVAYYPLDMLASRAEAPEPIGVRNRIQTVDDLVGLFGEAAGQVLYRRDPVDLSREDSCTVILSISKEGRSRTGDASA